jgi:hypothetical protein
MPGPIRYRAKPAQSGISLVRYRNEIMDAGMPMLLSSMPMPSYVVNPTEPLLRKRLTSDGTSLWSTGDPIHLSPDAYRDLAGALSEEGDGSVTGGPDSSTSAPSEGLKRRNPESVVTMPKIPAAK